MKVVIISTNDIVGGAAIVASRLLDELPHVGVEATMLVMHKSGSNPLVVQYGNNLRGKLCFLAERAEIFVRNGFNRKDLFKVSTARFGLNLSNHPLVKDADVVVINWINQGALSLKSIREICASGKPVVWIMHDMWQATGICHHSLGCEYYTHGLSCGECKYLKSNRHNDLSHTVFCRKRNLYAASNMNFVAVSSWLAGICKDSSLLADVPVRVIHNAFPIDDFDCERINTFPEIAPHKKVIVMGAARLDDPIKEFPILIEATKYLKKTFGESEELPHLLLFGGIRNAELLNELAVPYTYLGVVKGNRAVSEIYRNADVVVSTSSYETLPGTLIEGAAAGCVPVSFGNSGQTDIVEHLGNGYLADYLSPESIAQGIIWAMNSEISRRSLHDDISERFSAGAIALKYKVLFETLLGIDGK